MTAEQATNKSHRPLSLNNNMAILFINDILTWIEPLDFITKFLFSFPRHRQTEVHSLNGCDGAFPRKCDDAFWKGAMR